MLAEIDTLSGRRRPRIHERTAVLQRPVRHGHDSPSRPSLPRLAVSRCRAFPAAAGLSLVSGDNTVSQEACTERGTGIDTLVLV